MVADGVVTPPGAAPAIVLIEHASGLIDVAVDYENGPDGFKLRSAGLLRTARLLARGEVFVPSSVWRG